MQAEILYSLTEYNNNNNSNNNKGAYTNYVIRITHGSLTWTLKKRYSEFVELRSKLTSQSQDDSDAIPRSLIPQLPAKYYYYSPLTASLTSSPSSSSSSSASGSLKPEIVAERTKGLFEFMRLLLEISNEYPNRFVLQFFGVLTSPLDGVLDKTHGNRAVISLHSLADEARVGDIILFRCTFPLSIAQRSITGAEWDHIGLVVPDIIHQRGTSRRRQFQPSHGGNEAFLRHHILHGKRLLESSGSGVTCLPLIPRLKAYVQFNCCEYMALRPLKNILKFDENHLDADVVMERGLRVMPAALIGENSNSITTSTDSEQPQEAEVDCNAKVSSGSQPQGGLGVQQHLLKLEKDIAAFLAKVDGKGYGFKLADLFAAKTKSSAILANSQPNASVGADVDTSVVQEGGGWYDWRGIWNSTVGSIISSVATEPQSSQAMTTPAPGASASSPPAQDDGPASYFCSELVALGQQELGILPGHLNPGYFWPGSFAAEGLMDQCLEGTPYAYGPEMIIDCREMAITASTRTTEVYRTSSQRKSAVAARNQSEGLIPFSVPLESLDEPSLPNQEEKFSSRPQQQLESTESSMEDDITSIVEFDNYSAQIAENSQQVVLSGGMEVVRGKDKSKNPDIEDLKLPDDSGDAICDDSSDYGNEVSDDEGEYGATAGLEAAMNEQYVGLDGADEVGYHAPAATFVPRLF